MSKSVKYILMSCVEREMSIAGIYQSMEEAKEAMLLDMAEALDCTPEDIIAAYEGEEGTFPDCEDFFIEEASAWANDVGLAHAYYDWKILELDVTSIKDK